MEQNNQQPQQNQQQNSNTNNSNPNPAVAPQAQAPQQKPQPQQPAKPQNPPAPVSAQQSKKNLIISGAIIIAVLALLLVVPNIKRPSSATDTSDVKTEEGASPADSITGANTGKGSVRGTSATQSRAEALAAYQGKMITIGEDCSVTPDTQKQTKGTTVLINNDSTTSHRITVGPKAYTVSGLHYTLSWLNLQPGTLVITCDGKDTQSTIVVE